MRLQFIVSQFCRFAASPSLSAWRRVKIISKQLPTPSSAHFSFPTPSSVIHRYDSHRNYRAMPPSRHLHLYYMVAHNKAHTRNSCVVPIIIIQTETIPSSSNLHLSSIYTTNCRCDTIINACGVDNAANVRWLYGFLKISSKTLCALCKDARLAYSQGRAEHTSVPYSRGFDNKLHVFKRLFFISFFLTSSSSRAIEILYTLAVYIYIYEIFVGMREAQNKRIDHDDRNRTASTRETWHICAMRPLACRRIV